MVCSSEIINLSEGTEDGELLEILNVTNNPALMGSEVESPHTKGAKIVLKTWVLTVVLATVGSTMTALDVWNSYQAVGSGLIHTLF